MYGPVPSDSTPAGEEIELHVRFDCGRQDALVVVDARADVQRQARTDRPGVLEEEAEHLRHVLVDRRRVEQTDRLGTPFEYST